MRNKSYNLYRWGWPNMRISSLQITNLITIFLKKALSNYQCHPRDTYSKPHFKIFYIPIFTIFFVCITNKNILRYVFLLVMFRKSKQIQFDCEQKSVIVKNDKVVQLVSVLDRAKIGFVTSQVLRYSNKKATLKEKCKIHLTCSLLLDNSRFRRF